LNCQTACGTRWGGREAIHSKAGTHHILRNGKELL
jgi:hypothetical protein